MENGQDYLSPVLGSRSKEESLLSAVKFWEETKTKKEKRVPWLRFQDTQTRKKLDLGPGGAAGIGFGLIGGAGYGAAPWNTLRFAFGIGFGCGIGIGYGFGHGIGILWDRKIPKPPSGKVVIIEI
ncbi:hypothetical protein KP509_35G014100 [Ceratopteris richardii]|uniref:Uncharacterized protein n=1 Tax=Ceratopteris richardii TaxID=49495 RepID=A0A8T2QEP1_CERRI|nr:hypothetical protein KP509_35G014100 [Ceratopteris richardii]